MPSARALRRGTVEAMAAGRRFLLAGLAVAAAEAVLGLVGLRSGLAPYLFACSAATVVVAIGTFRLLARPPRRDDDEDGGSPRGPEGPDDDPPPWWPEFEDAFRAHVRMRERPRPPVH